MVRRVTRAHEGGYSSSSGRSSVLERQGFTEFSIARGHAAAPSHPGMTRNELQEWCTIMRNHARRRHMESLNSRVHDETSAGNLLAGRSKAMVTAPLGEAAREALRQRNSHRVSMLVPQVLVVQSCFPRAPPNSRRRNPNAQHPEQGQRKMYLLPDVGIRLVGPRLRLEPHICGHGALLVVQRRQGLVVLIRQLQRRRRQVGLRHISVSEFKVFGSRQLLDDESRMGSTGCYRRHQTASPFMLK